jgi:chromosomal replication initiator protein
MTISQIQQLVAARHRLTLRDLLSRRTARRLARPRQIAMWLACHITTCSIPEIGRAFDRDHTTVLYGIGKIEELMNGCAQEAADVLALLDELSPEAGADYRAIARIAA